MIPKKSKSQLPLKVNQIVPISFVIVLILVGIATAISEVSNSHLTKMRIAVAHTFKVKELLQEMEQDLVDAEAEQREYLITGKEDYLQPYATGRKNFTVRSENLKQLLTDNPSQVTRTEKVVQLAQQKFAELEETIALKKAGKDQEMVAVLVANKNKQTMNGIRAKLAEMNQQEQILLEQKQEASDQFQRLSTMISWGGWLFSVGAGIYISYFVARQIMQPINQAANTIANSSTNIAASVFQQERNILQQSVSVNETTTTIEEVEAFALQSAEQAETSAIEAKQALILAEEGSITVELTIKGISALKDQVTAIANQTVHLNQQTTQISKISYLVAELANKTNMLALNAEVEAARVRDQGKGFGLVANEIRKLAEQSRKSADEIKVLINQVQAAINSTVTVTDEGTKRAKEGIKLAQETGYVFTNITGAVNQVFLNNQQIVLSAKQQALAVQQITSAMNTINLGAKETAAAITQLKNAIVELNDTAQNLKNLT